MKKRILGIIGMIIIIIIIICIVVWFKSSTNSKQTLNDKQINSIIKDLNGVTSTCVVTEDNDPNGNLNKQGSYVGAVYFRLSQVDDAIAKEEYSTPLSDDACEEATAGGGQIEIYRNEDDAKGRNKYLSTTDSFIASGYHIVKDNLVIRVSNELTATQQKEIANKIIDLLEE